jgi:hypothetical protein
MARHLVPLVIVAGLIAGCGETTDESTLQSDLEVVWEGEPEWSELFWVDAYALPGPESWWLYYDSDADYVDAFWFELDEEQIYLIWEDSADWVQVSFYDSTDTFINYAEASHDDWYWYWL